MKIDYEKELNKSQLEAVKLLNGLVVLNCGPGSGKTRVITYKLHYMINEYKIKPENILVATFTKKAANEMKERLKKLFPGEELKKLYIGTFHSLGYKILKHEYILLEDPMAEFQLLEGPPIKWMIKEILNDLKINTTDKYNESTFEKDINKLKMELISPECMLMDFLLETPTKEQKELMRVYEEYEKRKRDKKLIDYNDMLYQLYNLFIQYPNVLEKYQNKFQYIMVDEAQDNAHHQYELIKMLMQPHNNVFIIGDPDQSIFGFRGARPEKFINFNDNENIININLEENYRSLPFITEAANNLIKNNKIRLDKKIVPYRHGEGKVEINYYKDENDEAQNIADMILSLSREGYSYDDITIIYRINAQSGGLEDALMTNSIPYVSHNMSFYERSEIKDVVAYLRLAHDINDNEAFERIYNKPTRYLGKVFLEDIKRESKERKISYFEALNWAKQYRGKNTVIEFRKRIEIIQQYIKTDKNVGETIEHIRREFKYDEFMMKENIDEEDNIKIDNLNVLSQHATKYNNIDDFLHYINNFTQNKNTSGVKLSTIHQSKGLEFPIVFLVGISDGLLPHMYSLINTEKDAIEEERRLMYVGITRAQDKLFISSIDNFQGRKLGRSRFINEI